VVAVKTQQADSFVKRADPKIKVLLIYGPDEGLVSERARNAATAWSRLEDPPGEILRIDEPDLDDNPDKLAIELQTMPMFGGGKVVRTAMGRKINAAMLKGLVEDGALEATLIIEGGNLKPTDALRKATEKLPHAAAIACYADETRTLSDLLAEELRQFKLTIDADAEEALVARLGADRAMSRGEIQKLCLYAMKRGRISVDDVEAVVGDASELALDRISTLTASGQGKTATIELSRALAVGESAQTVILFLQRHMVRLHLIRSAMADGRSVTEAARALRPPLHFKQRDVIQSQCKLWSPAKLDLAVRAVFEAAAQARRKSSLEDVLAERLILTIAHLANPAR